VQVVNGDGAVFRHDAHPRTFDENHYVYAVLSRRARGVSIGINLSPAKSCNFDCVYCQVDRTAPAPIQDLDETRLLDELKSVLAAAASGALLDRARQDGTAAPLLRIADVAFSGDGEPTSYANFAELVTGVGRLIDAGLPGTPLTLITNASLFHLPRVRAGLDALAARGGQIWAKLDAGTEEFYRAVNRSTVPFARVLDNIREEALRHPLVIQSLFLRRGTFDLRSEEIDAYAGRLAAIVAAGGRLAGVQVTTVARRPPQPDVLALPQEALEEISRRVRAAVPGVPVEVFASPTGAPARSAPPPPADMTPAGPGEEARR
jgi:wyosine [tRNA(Phe)-imidazoG37] synthetase (radical SAM superfamily)